MKSVGLSNICYSEFEYSWPHGEIVIVLTVISLELPGEVLKRIKQVGRVEAFIVLCKITDELGIDTSTVEQV